MTRMLIGTHVEVRASHAASSRIINIAETREALLADARTHFETLSQSPDDLLRHLGSPFAPDRRPTHPQALPHDRLASMLSVL
jgi:hypothetical protein